MMKYKEQRVERTLDNLRDNDKDILNQLYASGYHDGRHDERDKWSKCDYLIIDPDKRQEILETLKNNPCKDCEFNTKGKFRIHCYKALGGEDFCDKYNKMLFLSELVEHFDKKKI